MPEVRPLMIPVDRLGWRGSRMRMRSSGVAVRGVAVSGAVADMVSGPRCGFMLPPPRAGEVWVRGGVVWRGGGRGRGVARGGRERWGGCGFRRGGGGGGGGGAARRRSEKRAPIRPFGRTSPAGRGKRVSASTRTPFALRDIDIV